jgi:hypothetical protein
MAPREPWWPQRSAPPQGGQQWVPPTGADSARSGSIKLTSTSGAAGNEGARGQQVLCNATFDTPTPCTVHIGVALLASLSAGGRNSWDFVSETQDGGSNVAVGSLIFEYGAGAAKRRVTCDLRPGSYQLPPCNEVTVYIKVADESSF